MIDLKYAGVDWLTMTSKDDRVGEQWYSTYVKYRKARKEEGDQENQFNNGFYGGTRIASMSVGYSDAIGFIVIVSGADAERMFRRFKVGKHRVTRLDLCIDFQYYQPFDLAGTLFEKQSKESGNRQRKFSLFSGSDLGKTFYLGSRKSMQYGRVYDKGIQSGSVRAGLLWRAEVEYKKPISGSMADGLWKVQPEERELTICDTVCEWFAERGAELFPLGDFGLAVHTSVVQRVTTAQRKLAWLHQQVAPTVTQLISAGYGKEVLNTLLLDVETISRCLREDI